jgi:hypothetical protein
VTVAAALELEKCSNLPNKNTFRTRQGKPGPMSMIAPSCPSMPGLTKKKGADSGEQNVTTIRR